MLRPVRAPKTVKGGLTLIVHRFAAMTLDDVPLFATLKSRLSYLADRQQVIAQNVANTDTPGFTPSDLKPFALPGTPGSTPGLPPIAPTMTSPMHMAGTQPRPLAAKPIASPDSETTLDGNSVVLEEEMMRMSQARMDYNTAITFYQQSIAMIQTAAKRPGT
jgi:flagellar basal-body rod protein FlgB